MKIIIITYDEPFYFGKVFDYLFSKLPSWVSIRGIVILDTSPFAKSDTFWARVKKTYVVFGLTFFIRYLLKYMKSKYINRGFLIRNVMKKYSINEIKLPERNINANECLGLFASFRPDLIISIGANQIFKSDIINLPKYGCLNLHTALLPKYKGLMPTFWALKNNEKELGVSVFFMDEGIDTGEIVVQKVITIGNNDSLESLIYKSKIAGMDGIVESINLINSGSYKTTKLSSDGGSYYSFPTRKDVKEFTNAGKRFW